MGKVIDFIFGLILVLMLITSTLSKESFMTFQWVGTVLCVTVAFVSIKWQDEKIHKLEDEINNLKNK